MITFKVQGLNELNTLLKTIPKRIQGEVEEELRDGAGAMVQQMKADAPGHEGFLRNHISSFQRGPLTFEVVSAADYSAYVEFGTRSKAQIPAGLEQVAAQYRNLSSPGDAKKAIYEWCRLKGIEEKFWWSIYISIMTNGTRAQPYFFKNYVEVSPKIVANIKKVIANL